MSHLPVLGMANQFVDVLLGHTAVCKMVHLSSPILISHNDIVVEIKLIVAFPESSPVFLQIVAT